MDLFYNLPIDFLEKIALKRYDTLGDKFHFIINTNDKMINQLIIDLRWFQENGDYYNHPVVINTIRKLNPYYPY